MSEISDTGPLAEADDAYRRRANAVLSVCRNAMHRCNDSLGDFEDGLFTDDRAVSTIETLLDFLGAMETLLKIMTQR